MTKNNEKFIRVKYLRALEKVVNSIIKAIKRDDFDSQKFVLLMDKNEKFLSEIEPAILHDSYPKALEIFVNLAISQKSENSVQNTLKRSANALEKFKKAKEYKRMKNDKNFND